MAEEKWYNKPIKGIPKSEKIAVRYYMENGIENNLLKYIITVDRFKNYKLYEYKDEQAIYTKHKSDNPLDLNKYIKE